MKDNKIKLIATAILLGIPVSSVLIQDREASATFKVTANAFKGVSSKSPLVKPIVPPKPKLPSNINMINKNSGSFFNTNTTTNNQNIQKPNFAGNRHTISSGSVSQKVAELNLNAGTPGQIKLNLKNFSQKGSSTLTPNQKLSLPTSNRLNLNSDFKTKLNSLLGNGSTPTTTPKPSNNVGKLNMNNAATQKLEGIFGGNTQTSGIKTQPTTVPTSQNSLVQNNQNIPPAPPLPTGNAPIIPDAPPLPTGKAPVIPDAPPLPTGKPQVSHTLTNKTNSLTNKDSLNRPGLKPQKPSNTGSYDNVLGELQLKLNSRK